MKRVVGSTVRSVIGARHLATQGFFPSFRNTAAEEEFNNKKIKDYFRLSKQDVMSDFEEIMAEKSPNKNSLEVGHKLIAMRTTLLPRMHLEIKGELRDEVGSLEEKIGHEALKERIEENRPYIRFTAHPTEGQNLRAIREKDIIVKLQTALVRVQEQKSVLPENVVKIARLASEAGIENSIIEDAKLSGMPSFTEFSDICSKVRREIITNFIEKPIHHVTKMTIQDERDLLLYHMDRCKKEVSAVATKYPNLIEVDDIKFTSWSFDMDGKPHVKAGNGVIFEYQSQQKFFDSLLKMSEDYADEIELCVDIADFRESLIEFREEVVDPIKQIQKDFADRVLVGDEAKLIENKIIKILDDYDSSREEGLSESFKQMRNYVKSSGCKAAENGFTTREEIDKTNDGLAEITRICSAKPSFATDEVGTIAASFSEFSSETKRQVMCMMESALMHPTHEHIISQFNCELSSFKNVLKLFELSKQLPEYHESIPYFKEYYSEKSKEAGFDIYQQFFSESAIAAAKNSVVEISPLAEDEVTIPLLINFTKEMLADEECVDYIKKSGGVVRQTRSNSDGSSSLGAHKVTIRYLEADTAIREMVEAAGFKLAILQGIGANDLERMAPWRLELLQSEFTAQGSDAQHQTRDRLTSMLLKERDSSQEDLINLKLKYSAQEIESLVDFYYQGHVASERGVEIELDGKPVNSGDLTHRGSIPATVVKKLGKLSSRPDNRSGDIKTEALKENTMDAWDPSIFNRNMRRIGAISLQRASGVSTFSMAPFYQDSKDFSQELLADFSKIPLIRNTAISAIFALGIADVKSFTLANGLDFEIPNGTIPATAKVYEEFLKTGAKHGSKAAMQFAKENDFDSAEGMRAAHMCYQVEGCKRVLKNAITPLCFGSSKETQAALGKIFEEIDSSPESIIRYNKHVIKACSILVKDSQLDLATRQTLACVAQQISNVCRSGNFYDTRTKLISGAHKALSEGNGDKFNEDCEWFAIITRSAGNPASPGRKTNELLRYSNDSFNKTVIPMANLINPKEEDQSIKSVAASR